MLLSISCTETVSSGQLKMLDLDRFSLPIEALDVVTKLLNECHLVAELAVLVPYSLFDS